MKYRIPAALAAFVTLMAMLGIASSASADTDAIAQRYNSDSALRTLLGPSTDSEFSVAGGRQQDFKWGSLYWTQATGVHEVHGAIWSRYKGLGGPKSFLGFPKTDEQNITSNEHGEFVHQGQDNQFTGGEIVWNVETNATTWMDAAIAAKWNFIGQPWPYFGMPDGDQIATPHNGHRVSFGDASIYESSASGTHSVINGDTILGWTIKTEYDLTNGAWGPLGLPTADGVNTPTTAHPNGRVQTFQNGGIYQPDAFAMSHEVQGAIYWTYTHNNNFTKLGFPTSDEQAAPGGRISHFDHGTIFWNASTNQVTVTVTP